jgi:hypothetical protein
MSQPPDTSNPFDPFGFWKNTQGQTLDAWSKAMIDLVNTDAYAEATGRMLDSYLTVSAPMRKLMEQTMAQVLGQMNLPTRTEVLSLAERLTNMEMRLDDLDARLDAILRAVERTGQAVTAASATNRQPSQASAQPAAPMPARRIQRPSAPTTRRAPTTPE